MPQFAEIYETLLLTACLICWYPSSGFGAPIYPIPMNTTSYLLAGLTSAALTFSPFTSHAARDTALDTVKIRQQLSSVPNPELPAKAASLVLIDQSANRQKNTEVIVG